MAKATALYDNKRSGGDDSKSAEPEEPAKTPESKDADPADEPAAEDKDKGADFLEALKGLHGRHEAERRDFHGNHRDQLRQMAARHAKDFKDHFAMHSEAETAGVAAPESAGAATKE